MNVMRLVLTLLLNGRIEAPHTLVEPIGYGDLQLPRTGLKWVKAGDDLY